MCVLDGQSMHFLHLTDWEGAKILPGQDEDVESCVWFQVVRGQRPCCPNHGAPLHRTIWAHPGHLCGLIPTFPEVEEYLTEETDGNLTGADFSCWHLWRVRQPLDGLIAGHVFWKFVLAPEVRAPKRNWAGLEQDAIDAAGWVHIRELDLDDCIICDTSPNGWDDLLHNEFYHLVHDTSNTFHHVHVGIYVHDDEGFGFSHVPASRAE